MSRILIAEITKPVGLKGEVKLKSYCTDPEDLLKYPKFDEDQNPIKFKITATGGSKLLTIKIPGIDDRDSADKLRGKKIFTDRKNFKPLTEEEFYYTDLIGLEVIDTNSKPLGKVINIYDHGAGASLEIEFSCYEPKRIESFAFRNQIFPEVNLKAGFVRIDLPEVV